VGIVPGACGTHTPIAHPADDKEVVGGREELGFTLDSRWIHIGLTLDSHWIQNESTLDSHRIYIELALDSHWIRIGIQLGSRWIHNGFILDSHYQMPNEHAGPTSTLGPDTEDAGKSMKTLPELTRSLENSHRRHHRGPTTSQIHLSCSPNELTTSTFPKGGGEAAEDYFKPQRQEHHRFTLAHSFASHAPTKRSDVPVVAPSNVR